MVFRKIIMLDFARISARLRLGRKYPISSSHITQLYQAFHTGSSKKLKDVQLSALREKVAVILNLYRTLKSNPVSQQNPDVYDIMERMIRILHTLSSSAEFGAALDNSSALNTIQKISLRDSIVKLSQYFRASAELTVAARRRSCRIFQRIRVESFQINVPDEVRMPSSPDSAFPLIKALAESNHDFKLLRQCNGSKSKASAALIRRLDSTRSGIKVHAEIKLLFYYESRPKKSNQESFVPIRVLVTSVTCF